jgi:ATP phosphoribosyltransferase
MTDMVTIALSKGRILEDTLPFLAGMGVELVENPEKSRKLIIGTSDPRLRIIIVRASDVPTYVQRGAADLGVAGKDVLLEQSGDSLFELVDLGIARCKMMVAAPIDFDYQRALSSNMRLRVASKYVKTASAHFARKGIQIDLIKLYGSMELAPLVGLGDVIVDLVSTGKTLEANNLVPVEEVLEISSRLIVNTSSLKLKRGLIQPFINAFERTSN